MRHFIPLVCLVAIICCTAANAAAQLPDGQEGAVERINAFIEDLIESPYAPPGFAIVIVSRDGPILIRGYGMADLEMGQPVTEHTQFYNASVTKQYTALALAGLAAQGIVDLDAPVSELVPGFRFEQSGIDAQAVTLRQLLTHSSGTYNSSINFVTGFLRSMPPEEIVEHFRVHTRPISETFAYGNFGYVVADAWLQLDTGHDWRHWVSTMLLDPLGMSETTAFTDQLVPGEFAMSYEPSADGWIAAGRKPADLMHAAGGLYTSAHDTAIWLEAQLNAGRVDGEQRLPAEWFDIAHEVTAEQDRSIFGFERTRYAMGWNVGTYDGDIIYEHGGGYAGARAWNSMMPEHGWSVAVFANAGQGANLFNVLVMEQVYDELRGVPDAAERAESRLTGFDGHQQREWETVFAQEQATMNFTPWTQDPADLELVAGRYVSDRLGEIVLAMDGDRLLGRFGAQTLEFLPQETPDHFLVSWGNGHDQFRGIWTVVRDETGERAGLDWEGRQFQRASE